MTRCEMHRQCKTKAMHKKTAGYELDFLINTARRLIRDVGEVEALERLSSSSKSPGTVWLAVQAAKLLDQPYVYREKKDRKIVYEDV